MTTKAEFLAPLILTLPFRGVRPQIFRTELSVSDEFERFGELAVGVMGLSSRIYWYF